MKKFFLSFEFSFQTKMKIGVVVELINEVNLD